MIKILFKGYFCNPTIMVCWEMVQAVNQKSAV